jgi:hypothetical protein
VEYPALLSAVGCGMGCRIHLAPKGAGILLALYKLDTFLHQPPAEVGYDAPAWTPKLLREFLEDRYDVSYSLSSCRRLMRETGLSYQTPRRTATEADPAEQDQFHEKRNKARDAGRHGSLYRSDREIRANRAACRVVSKRHAAERRTVGTARLEVSTRRDHRRR